MSRMASELTFAKWALLQQIRIFPETYLREKDRGQSQPPATQIEDISASRRGNNNK